MIEFIWLLMEFLHKSKFPLPSRHVELLHLKRKELCVGNGEDARADRELAAHEDDAFSRQEVWIVRQSEVGPGASALDLVLKKRGKDTLMVGKLEKVKLDALRLHEGDNELFFLGGEGGEGGRQGGGIVVIKDVEMTKYCAENRKKILP